MKNMTWAELMKEIKPLTCDLCGIESKNYAEGAEFWNCLCENCWNQEKDRI